MEKKTEKSNESVDVSRGDFLKMAGAAGLGLAGLSAFMSAPTSAQEGKKKEISVCCEQRRQQS